ncbi:Putative pentatricopeptide repeat-containing protein At5g52630 [Linum grandiflorum]
MLLHKIPSKPLKQPPTILSTLLQNVLTHPTPPQIDPPQQSAHWNHVPFEEKYRYICTLLLSQTRSRNLHKGVQLHAHIVKSGLGTIPLVSHYLINFYSKNQLPMLSASVFDETQVRSATTWSSVISSLSQNELPGLAIEYFRKMLEQGFSPDDHIYPSATKACAIMGRWDVGKSVHCHVVKTGYEFDVFVGSSLVDMYCKCGKLRDARNLFDEMPEKNVVSWSGMIYGYAQVGEDEEALKLFKGALYEGLEVNDFTFSSVIRVCGDSTLLELGKQIHGMCFKTSYDSSSFVGSSLVSLYSRCGVIEEAYVVFEEVPVKNLGMWNAMLIACAQHGHTKQVFDLFEELQRVSGINPNFITFLCLLYACSHSGLVKEGEGYFELMKKRNIEPGAQHYSSLVGLLSRAGKLQEALKIIETMPIEPTESVWGAFMTGCRIHGNTELAAYAADRVFQLGAVSPGLHVILSNAYAAAGRYEDAARARKLLRDQGIKKETGLSWVEEGNKVHTFAAGDRSHSRTKEIYEKLEELGHKMEKAGYVPDTSFVLREVGGEEKHQTIRFHSERLAIAFGLIAFADTSRPLRVMKNLRVCGDCHTAIKFMSKCTGRVIVVRDNNRFHRFEDGKCSCGDYW